MASFGNTFKIAAAINVSNNSVGSSSQVSYAVPAGSYALIYGAQTNTGGTAPVDFAFSVGGVNFNGFHRTAPSSTIDNPIYVGPGVTVSFTADVTSASQVTAYIIGVLYSNS